MCGSYQVLYEDSTKYVMIRTCTGNWQPKYPQTQRIYYCTKIDEDYVDDA
jgi:hypothetical protein